MRGRLITFLILFLLLAGPVRGAEQTTPTPAKPSPPPPKQTPAKTVQTEQKPLPWPRPYKPTEEISADSAVPFPTDI